jgi:hypothetical protein
MRKKLLFLFGAGACVITSVQAQGVSPATNANLAVVATPSTSFVSGHETLAAINDGLEPKNSGDKRHGAYGNWPLKGTQWVQYEWSQPVSISRADVYWFSDGGGVRLPVASRLLYWDGSAFVPVKHAAGLGVQGDTYNTTTFDAITVSKLKLEFDSLETASSGILEFKVYDSGKSPAFPPVAEAGVDRSVMLSGTTWLSASAKTVAAAGQLNMTWSKKSGPGNVRFENAAAAETIARFSKPGAYVLECAVNDGRLTATDTLNVRVETPPPAVHLDPVYTLKYKVDSPLWNSRVKKLITNWIPHCYTKISDPEIPEGGIENFTQAGNKNAGRPFTPHRGPVFANAWVHNTFESMCVAMQIDPQGDPEIIAAQSTIKAKIEDWLPKLLSAQEADGYLQTCYTLNNFKRWTNKADHEGYLAGYFMEAAMAHYLMTDRKDPRMYEAAKRLADCWYANIGPAPKKAWYEGHQELEQALVRLGRFVEDVEGKGKGSRYIDLAKFLMDSRKDGDAYDQSHLPVIRQYEAVGHAVRAVYSYAGMADIAMETGDVDYQSAVMSIWDNIVNKKYYVTGGVGSGETTEGFGKNYSLPNNAYCESCSGSGELFFQHKMNMTYHDAKYADLYEETIYNAILGDIDIEGQNFTYTNPLDSSHARYKWHVCPCCIGNIPRTLLMLPTWMYVKGEDGLYINLFVGSSVRVENVAGTDVELVQKTDYPWSGEVKIILNPAQSKRFALRIRQPDRQVSGLYTSTPSVSGLTRISVNGQPVTPKTEKGYAVITRKWKAGDTIELVIPMKIQRVKADPRVAADVGKVALRYGPLVYNIESADQDITQMLKSDAALTTEWKPDLLCGITVIKGTFANGAPLTAIPNYARNNRAGRSIVWIKDN